MHFETDKQTLDDLMIFGKAGSDSVYGLFNRTVTRGGAKLLEEWFRYPMADPEKIANRSLTIRRFADAETGFPFPQEIFDILDGYLADTDRRSKLQPRSQSVTDRLSQLVASDPAFKRIEQGVLAVLAFTRALDAFVDGYRTLQVNEDPYGEDVEKLTAFLADPEIVGLLAGSPKAKLPYEDIAAHDQLFRFVKREQLQAVLRLIHQLDVYLAVASVARERDFCFPEVLEAERHEVDLTGVYHPLVKNAKGNSLRITPSGNIVFLTGANMAGKSTLMKSLGIALYLAHMGFPVPATEMRFSVREGIYTTINLPDNLGMGVSHFYAEVLRIKKMARELSRAKNLFIIFDELFRGTNVKDAYEATVAITSAFAAKQNCMFVVSTHIMEAGESLRENCPNINFVYLPTRMDGNKPVYTYRLEQGITADRHGMVIVNNAGILDILNKNNKQQRA